VEAAVVEVEEVDLALLAQRRRFRQLGPGLHEFLDAPAGLVISRGIIVTAATKSPSKKRNDFACLT
jgi:hypothetical protein